MNERQAVGGVAVATHSRLGDAAAIHLHAGAEGAHLALEERLLHLGDELRGADHHAADGDQLIDVCRDDTGQCSQNPPPHMKYGMEYFARAAGDTVWIYTHLLGSGSSCFWFSGRCRGGLGSGTRAQSQGSAQRKAH